MQRILLFVQVSVIFEKWIWLEGVRRVAAGFMPPSYSQERLRLDRQTPVVKVYERTHKSVVNVSGEQTVARRFDSQSAYPILIVTEVEARGIAGQTGVQPGDLLLQVNDATRSPETPAWDT